jgi:hypothetical protein
MVPPRQPINAGKTTGKKPLVQRTRVSPGVYRDENGNLGPNGSGPFKTSPTTGTKKTTTVNANAGTGTAPIYQLGTNEADINKQIARSQAELQRAQASKNKKKIALMQGRITQGQEGLKRLGQGFTAGQQRPEDVSQGATDLTGRNLEYIGQQGQFQPGDFAAQRQKASDAAYSMFSSKNEPQFQQQVDYERQKLFNEGIPEGSDQYNQRMGQLTQGQNEARLQAQNQAFLTGQGEQAQGYNQAYQTYQQPYQNIQYLNPTMGINVNNNMLDRTNQFTKEQAERENQYRLQQIKSGGGGSSSSGGLSYDQQRQLMIDQYMLQMTGKVGGAQQNPYGAAIQGFANGLGSGLTNQITRR